MTAEIVPLPRAWRATVVCRDAVLSTVLPTREGAEAWAATIERIDRAAGQSTVPGATHGVVLPSDAEPTLPYRVLP